MLNRIDLDQRADHIDAIECLDRPAKARLAKHGGEAFLAWIYLRDKPVR